MKIGGDEEGDGMKSWHGQMVVFHEISVSNSIFHEFHVGTQELGIIEVYCLLCRLSIVKLSFFYIPSNEDLSCTVPLLCRFM